MPEISKTLDVLRDFIVMTQNEIEYVETGKHPGRSPMRDCLGQWKASVREAREVLLAAEDGEPFV